MFAGRNMIFFSSRLDPHAAAYVKAVEVADGQALEDGVKLAYNDFIIGCKADGSWSAIQCCCILMGARTLAGALIPLKGPAPTNLNFVGADYNRRKLTGDGSKLLDTNYLNNNQSLGNFHFAASWIDRTYAAYYTMFYTSGYGVNGVSYIGWGPSNTTTTIFAQAFDVGVNAPSVASGFWAATRNTTTAFNYVTPVAGSLTVTSNTSVSMVANTYKLRPYTTSDFYSVGTYIADLAAFKARHTTLQAAIATIVP